MDETLVILYEGVNDWTWFDGNLEEAIAHVKSDRRYCNYGRTGATIIKATVLYEIADGPIETLHEQPERS